jgi:hypothetical protein
MVRNRRQFLRDAFGIASAAMTTPALAYADVGQSSDEEEPLSGLHVLTRRLLDRGRQARLIRRPADRVVIERAISRRAEFIGRQTPSIRWVNSNDDALQILSQQPDLIKGSQRRRFWDLTEDQDNILDDVDRCFRFESVRQTTGHVFGYRQEIHNFHDALLRLPVSDGQQQPGVLEKLVELVLMQTLMAGAASESVAAIEVLLCAGWSEHSRQVQQLLPALAACENGLIGVLETPEFQIAWSS